MRPDTIASTFGRLSHSAGALFIGLLGLSSLQSTQAQLTSWSIAGAGDWNVAGNWTGGVPTAASSARLNNSGTAVLPAGVSGSYYSLYAGTASGDSGAISINGGLLSGVDVTYLGVNGNTFGSAVVSSGTWTSAGEFAVGFYGSGNLLINGGLVSTVAPTIAAGPGSTGSATITSGTWSNSSALTVGQSGTGSLNINGGLVTNTYGQVASAANAQGNVTVTSGTWANSSELRVGMSGTGTLSISGGRVSNTIGYLGYNESGNSTVTVTGGVWANSGQLRLGYTGTGRMLVDGGLVTNTTAYIGTNTTGNGSATVSSGTWASSGELVVGYFGTGNLLIDGGLVSNTAGTIGSDYSGNGTVTVTGQNSEWINTGNLVIGFNGSHNTLTIEDGALVKVGNNLLVSAGNGTDNFLRLDGGYIALYGNVAPAITSLIGSGYIQLWDGDEWVTATADDLEITYYATDAEGEAATGHDGLGGYTVATTQAVPEPTSFVLLSLGLGGLLCQRRRRGRAEARAISDSPRGRKAL